MLGICDNRSLESVWLTLSIRPARSWTIFVAPPLEFLMCSSSQASAPARSNSIVTS